MSRRQFVDALRAEGIPCKTAAYPPVHRTALFRLLGWEGAAFPNAERAASNTVWLPHHLLLGLPEQVTGIATAIAKLQLFSSTLAQSL